MLVAVISFVSCDNDCSGKQCYYPYFKNKGMWARKTAQRIKALSVKAWGLSLVPKILMLGGELKGASCSLTAQSPPGTHSHTSTQVHRTHK